MITRYWMNYAQVWNTGVRLYLNVDIGASILAGMVFFIAILLHIFYYRRALSKRSEAEVIHEEAVEIGVVLPKTTE